MAQTTSVTGSTTEYSGAPHGGEGDRLCRLMWRVTLVGAVAFVLFLLALGVWGAEIGLAVDSAYAESELQRAKDYESRGEIARAIESYRQALKSAFRNEHNRFICGVSLGDLLMRLGRFEDAVGAYAELPAGAFANAGAFAGYVTSLRMSGNLEEAGLLAKRWSETAERQQDKLQRVWAHTALGQIFWESGRLDEALSSFTLASKIDPSSPATAWAEQVHRRLGKPADAKTSAQADR